MTTGGRTPEAIAYDIALLSRSHAGSLGAWFLSLIVITFSGGLLASQATTYFTSYHRDPIWYKQLVLLAVLLTIAHFVVVFVAAWDWFVTSYGDWSVVVAVPWSVWTEPIVSQLNVSCAQLFFVHRCYVLTSSRVVVMLLLVLMLASFGVKVAVAVLLEFQPYNITVDKHLTVPNLALNLTIDTIITGLISWKLLSSRQGFNPNTDTVLTKLLAVTWEAAAPPMVTAIANIAVFETINPQNPHLTYVFLAILTSRLYVFSLMFTLNSRQAIREKLESHGGSIRTWTLNFTRLFRRGQKGDGTSRRTTATVVFAPMGGSSTIVTSAHLEAERASRNDGGEKFDVGEKYDVDEMKFPNSAIRGLVSDLEKEGETTEA